MFLFKKLGLSIYVFLVVLSTLSGQVSDTLAPNLILSDSIGIDTNIIDRRKGNFFTKDYPNPKKAVLFALILPGAGQAYNKKWWKIPLVYGALGGAGMWTAFNLNEYRRLRDNYKLLVDEDPNTNPTESPYDRIDAGKMKVFRDQYRKRTEYSYLFLTGAYLLGVTDAFVDAHLKQFDVSEDLSLRLKPAFQFGAANQEPMALGLGLQFIF